ncbi:MAG TPA: hypothetical protein VMH37_10605 [Candidatus Binataceae bacterium]|nr:hypothetical protein [Candidatus Binataceae bacterium]
MDSEVCVSIRSLGAEDNSVDHYYRRKAREVDQLIEQLKNGRTISTADQERALHTDHSQIYAPCY